jgi:hypothetical protein
MRPPPRPVSWLLASSAILACNRSQQDASSFAITEMPGTSAPQTGDAGGSSGSSGAQDSTSTSTTTTGEASTAAASGTTLVLDVGSEKDLGMLDPPGCKGKIDFLFLVSRDPGMKFVQQQVFNALPEFVATIEEKFADFDYHIMVVSGGPQWGLEYCNNDNCVQDCMVPDYPCDLLDTITTCDNTPGAGTVFNAGYFATNEPCDLYGANRYIIEGQPDLLDAFTCIARVGTSGYAKMMDQMVAALQPGINGPGGCNEGFLRDDALLFIARVANTPDTNSQLPPEVWPQAILDAKHGDPKSTVLFVLHPLDWQACLDHAQGHTCRMIEKFPYYVYENANVADYGPAFAEAADLVAEACTDFIPG